MSDHEKLREAIKYVRDNWSDNLNLEPSDRRAFAQVIAAAASTLPKTKMVEVWHVEYALHSRCPAIYLFNEKETADKQAAFMQKHAAEHGWHCIRVTGPHTQEVPA